MCGICGVVRFSGEPVGQGVITEMMASMKHRGPDDEGYFLGGTVGLGHVRLSIIDLSHDGRQPMQTPDGNLIISFNGEIYNYIELKRLLATEFTFRTATDTEVILHAYRKWGIDCLHRFNGMFAFALYDKLKCELYLVRDRFGVKPLYYYTDSDELIFSSEITPILRVLKNRPGIDEQSVYDFLLHNRTHHVERTFFKGIKKLQHGHWMNISERDLRIERWYDLKQHLKPPFSSPYELRDLLNSAVTLRLRSDVPVGACLSGGIDSSSIVSLCLKHEDVAGLNTFSATYPSGEKGDEIRYIRQYQNLVPNMHYARPTSQSFFEDLDLYISVMQEPIPGSSAYAEYKVFEAAKPYVTVILNGQGADETFGGYLYLLGYLYRGLLRDGKWGALLNELVHDIVKHRSLVGLKSAAYFSLPGMSKKFVAKTFRNYLNYEFSNQYESDPSICGDLYSANSLSEGLLSHFEHKFEHHLIWSDRSSMWFSLEARFPFLDFRVVERALSLASDQIIRKGETKWILRRAMEGLVPEPILNRQDKVGYETPEGKWFREPKWKEFILNLLNSPRFRERGYINVDKARQGYQRHLGGSVDLSREICKWLHLELWSRKFVDNRPGKLLPLQRHISSETLRGEVQL